MILKLRSLLPYVSLAAVVLAAIVLRLLSPHFSPIERFLNDASIRTNDLTPEVADVLGFLKGAAPDDTQWSINQNPGRGQHTVILFSGAKARTHREYVPYVKTIAWVSEYRTIVVDVDYLRDLAEQLTSLSSQRIENPYERNFREAATIKVFLLWVVGHEAGHAHYHDSTRHFAANSFEAPATGEAANQVIETRADDYVAHAVTASRQRTVDLAEMLFEILNANVTARLPESNLQGPSIPLFSKESVEVLASGSHPEFIVRAAQMLSEIRYPVGTDNQYGVWAKQVLERIQSSPGTDCSVMARTSPVSADVQVQLNHQTPIVYWSPANLLLSPGDYQITVSAKGYKTIARMIEIPDCKHAHDIDIQLEKVPPLPVQPKSPLEEFVSRREQTILRISHAQYLEQHGEWLAAEWELNRAMEIDPQASETVLLEALVKEHKGNLTESRDLHRRALSLRMHEIAGYDLGAYRLNQIQQQMGQSNAILRVHPGDVQANRASGELWLELGRYDLAQPLISKLEKQPGSCEDHINMSLLLFSLGQLHAASVPLDHATHCCGELSIDGTRAVATQLEAAHQEVKAEKWFTKAYQSDPEHAWSDLADFLSRHGRRGEALLLARAAMKRDSDDTDAINSAAGIEVDMGRVRTAELLFQRALKTYIDNSEALIGLAHIAGKRGDWARAREFCGDAVKSNSWDNFEGWMCIGDAEQALGHTGPSLIAYQNASWLQPRDHDAFSKIAQIYAKLSDRNRADLYRKFASEDQ